MNTVEILQNTNLVLQVQLTRCDDLIEKYKRRSLDNFDAPPKTIEKIVCCICANEDGLKEIHKPYNNAGVTEVYADMVESCFCTPVKNDESIKYICEECIKQLRECLDFKKKILGSENFLKKCSDNSSKELKNNHSSSMIDNKYNKNSPQTHCKGINGTYSSKNPHVLLEASEVFFNCETVYLNTDNNMAQVRSNGVEPTYHTTQVTSNAVEPTYHTIHAPNRRFSSDPIVHKHNDLLPFNGSCMCPLCSEVFYSIVERRQHIGVCHPQMLGKFYCEECGRIVSRRYQLLRHIKGVHVKEKCYHCTQCSESFVRPDQLKKHMLLFHPDKNQIETQYYMCSNCNIYLKHSELASHVCDDNGETHDNNLQECNPLDQPLLDNPMLTSLLCRDTLPQAGDFIQQQDARLVRKEKESVLVGGKLASLGNYGPMLQVYNGEPQRDYDTYEGMVDYDKGVSYSSDIVQIISDSE